MHQIQLARRDTALIESYILLGNLYQSFKPDSALIFHESARKLSIELKDELRRGESVNEIGWDYLNKGNSEDALKCFTEALEIAQNFDDNANVEIKNKAQRLKSSTLSNWGGLNNFKGEYPQAIDCYLKALKINKVILNKKGIAFNNGNLGRIYRMQGDFPKALSYYLQALKMSEELGNTFLSASMDNSLGNLYHEINDYKIAIKYYNKALQIFKESNDKKGISDCLGNLGIVYKNIGEYDKALDFAFKALKIVEEMGNKSAIARKLNTIGDIYILKGDYPRALSNLEKALGYEEKLGELDGVLAIKGQLGKLYISTKQYKKSESYLLQALILSDSIHSLKQKMVIESYLSDLYSQTGNYKLSLEYYKKHIINRDTLFNEQNTKKTIQTQMNYEFDKKQTADSIKTAEQAKVEKLKHNQEIQQQKAYTYGGFCGFLLMIIVAIVSFRAFRHKQKANEIISHQKQLVEEKQKEILDSIHYAKRIQTSLLPPEKYIDKNLKRLKK